MCPPRLAYQVDRDGEDWTKWLSVLHSRMIGYFWMFFKHRIVGRMSIGPIATFMLVAMAKLVVSMVVGMVAVTMMLVGQMRRMGWIGGVPNTDVAGVAVAGTSEFVVVAVSAMRLFFPYYKDVSIGV